MFGYIRFLLALLVVLSHIGIRFWGLNPGVMAVIVFYILAGYVVSHLYTDILPEGKYKIFKLYQDRIVRIFPLYLYVAALTVLFILTTSFGAPHFSFMATLANLTIIPLNYYMVADFTILTNPDWWLIPPAWSLGAELQAYVLLSLVLSYERTKFPLAIVSLSIYIAANFSLIHPDYFGYRLIAGVFFIFLAGSTIQKINAGDTSLTTFDKYFPLAVWTTILLLLFICYITDTFSPTYTKETFIGLLVGIPLVYYVSKIKIKLPYNPELGALSYGLFLTHFLSIWILEYLRFTPESSSLYTVLVIAISILMAYSGVKLIEKNINR